MCLGLALSLEIFRILYLNRCIKNYGDLKTGPISWARFAKRFLLFLTTLRVHFYATGCPENYVKIAQEYSCTTLVKCPVFLYSVSSRSENCLQSRKSPERKQQNGRRREIWKMKCTSHGYVYVEQFVRTCDADTKMKMVWYYNINGIIRAGNEALKTWL